MTSPDFPSGLGALADQYDAALCDVWGVIHNGRRAYDEACEALTKFRAAGKRVILITNAPVPKKQVVGYFTPLGVPASAFDDCVTSGDATRADLARRTGEKIWRMGVDSGWERDQYLYAGLDLNFVAREEAETILCVGLEDLAKGHPEDHREELREAAGRHLPMICANPDIKVRIGDDLVWCAGALAQIYEEEGGHVIYPGKPHAPIYDLALARLKDLGGVPPRERILCIGDSPATDMQGATREGFDGLYVGTGLKEHGADFESEVGELLESYGQTARWAMSALRW